MSPEQQKIEEQTSYPLNKYFIVQNEDGSRYDLCERGSEDSMSGQRVGVLSDKWVADRRMRVIRPWRPEDDMNFLQKLALRIRNKWVGQLFAF